MDFGNNTSTSTTAVSYKMKQHFDKEHHSSSYKGKQLLTRTTTAVSQKGKQHFDKEHHSSSHKAKHFDKERHSSFVQKKTTFRQGAPQKCVQSGVWENPLFCLLYHWKAMFRVYVMSIRLCAVTLGTVRMTAQDTYQQGNTDIA